MSIENEHAKLLADLKARPMPDVVIFEDAWLAFFVLFYVYADTELQCEFEMVMERRRRTLPGLTYEEHIRALIDGPRDGIVYRLGNNAAERKAAAMGGLVRDH